MSVVERLDTIRAQLDDLREEVAAGNGSPSSGVAAGPEVQAAAEALARAVAQATGEDLPLQVAPGSSLPIVELPEEFQKYGGVGVAVMVAPATEAARNA